jgi:PAS domain S-box-containing protein
MRNVELQQTRDEVESGREKYIDVFDFAPIGYLILDKEGTIIAVNLRGAALLGVDRSQLIGRRFGLYVSDSDRPDFTTFLDNVFLTFKKEICEVSLLTEGDLPLIVQVNAIAAISGQECRITLLDITERIMAKQALLESEMRFRAIAENTPNMIMIHVDGKFVYLNPAAVKNFGIDSQKEYIGKPINEVVHPNAQNSVNERAGKITRINRPKIKAEKQLVRKDGNSFWVEITGFPSTYEGLEAVFVIAVDITDRKLAEETISNANKLLHTIINTAPMRVSWKDTQLRYLGCNLAFARDAGLTSPDEIIGKDDYQLTWKEQAGAYRADDRCVIESEAPRLFYTERKITPAGERLWFNTSKVPLRNEGNEVFGVLEVYEDITEQKRAESTLQARIRLSEYALTHSMDELLTKTLDEAEALTGSNIAFYHFVDLDKKQLNLHAWSTRTADQSCKVQGIGTHYYLPQAGVWADCIVERRAVIHNDYASLPHRKGMPAGHVEVVRELIVPVFQGDTIIAILGIGNKPKDYNDRDVEAVSQLANLSWDIVLGKRAEEALRENQKLLNSIMDGIPDPVYIKDLDSHMLFANPAWGKIIGKPVEEIIGLLPSEYYKNTEVGRMLREHDLRVIESGRNELMEETVPADGGERTFLSRKVPYRSLNGDVIGIIGVSHDITERKQQEEKLKNAQKESESASRAKSEFLANMSHEIRTPLNGVLGMADLLAMTDLSEEQQEYVNALKLSGKNLLSLINDILDLSKIEAGKVTIEYFEFNLNRSINDVVLMQKLSIHQKGLSLDVQLAGNIPHELMGDPLRVKQIIHNLVGNAVKFTSRGGIKISTRIIEREATSVLVQIAVSDSGIGIQPELLEYIFKPFVQGDGSTTRQYGGTGLGLTICRRLAELMGGSISVESTPGVGSCFRVTLPFAVIRKAKPVQETRPYTKPCWDGPKLRILLVEDDPVNAKLGMSLFKKIGHEIVTVGNGKECLAALEQEQFDLVLMDIQMPVMNGEETVREIRRMEVGTTHHQQVIALTAYALRGEKERFLSEGFDGYVSKPLEIKELISEMKKVVDMAEVKLSTTPEGNHGETI